MIHAQTNWVLQMTTHYLEAEAYNRLIDALLRVEPDAFTGKVERDGVTLALGEFGDIWPESILQDAEANNR